MGYFGIFVALCMGLFTQDTQEIALQNVDSQYMAVRLKSFFAEQKMKDVTISASTGKNALTVSGSKDGVAVAQRLVSLFDVRPKELNLTVDIESPNLKLIQHSQVQTSNGAKLSFEQESASISFSIQSRINEDMTATFSVGDSSAFEKSNVIRVAEGEIATFCITEDLQIQIIEPQGKIPKNVKAIVKFSFSIPGAKKPGSAKTSPKLR